MFKLEQLGWNAVFEKHFKKLGSDGYAPARVAEELKNTYRLYAACSELLAEVSGKLRFAATGHGDMPAAGDWVAAAVRPAEARATIHHVLPRKSKFSRKVAGRETAEQVVAANMDTVFVVTSLNRELNLRRLERYLTLVWESGARPVVLLTKSDLCEQVASALLEVERVAMGVPVHALSALTGEGLDAVWPYLAPGQTVALLGSSGVGKSTLINRLLGAEVLAVGEIRASDDRGRHTTTSRQLVLLPAGGLLMDTPGMRELQLWEADAGLGHTFASIEAVAAGCHFRDCRHESEPGCAVVEAIERGRLDAARLESYRKLERELRYLELKKDKAGQAAQRERWKKIHKAFRYSHKRS